MNSLALFIYCNNYDKTADSISVFNQWTKVCNMHFQDIQTVAAILEYIRKLLKIEHNDLGTALKYDFLIEED